MIELAKDPENWEFLKERITKVVGFNTSNYEDKFLKRRVECRLRALDLDSYSEYAKILISDPNEKDALHKELTIHFTSFFRDKEVFDVFFAQTIFELLDKKEKEGNLSLKIWSAGASTGEEAFSIMMMLSEILGERLKDFKISIIATDIDAQTIEKAKKGEYDEVQLREAPEGYIEKYFEKEGDVYRVKEDIRKYIRFSVGDILQPMKPKLIDVLFCRNTVIYFDQKVKERLYLDFAQCINLGGFLILGQTETLTGPAREYFKSIDNKHRVYRRVGSAFVKNQ